MASESTPTAERLRELLDYDPKTGVFRWRIRRGDRYLAGTIAGGPTCGGYWHIRVDERLSQAHHLAWLYVHGVWPTKHLDHRNGNRTDNRIANLREATAIENGQNTNQPKRNNKSGFLGVTRFQGRWRATISVNRKVQYLGSFDTPEGAHAAYLAAKAELHPFWSSR